MPERAYPIVHSNEHHNGCGAYGIYSLGCSTSDLELRVPNLHGAAHLSQHVGRIFSELPIALDLVFIEGVAQAGEFLTDLPGICEPLSLE